MKPRALGWVAVLACAMAQPAAAVGLSLPLRLDFPGVDLVGGGRGETPAQAADDDAKSRPALPLNDTGAAALRGPDARSPRRRAGGWRSSLPGAIR